MRILLVVLAGSLFCLACKEEPKPKKRGTPASSSFMNFARMAEAGHIEEAPESAVYLYPEEALQVLKNPETIEVVEVERVEGKYQPKGAWTRVPENLGNTIGALLQEIDNYGGPYMCVFLENYMLRFQKDDRTLDYVVCLGCDEFMVFFEDELIPRTHKLSFSPALEAELAVVGTLLPE